MLCLALVKSLSAMQNVGQMPTVAPVGGMLEIDWYVISDLLVVFLIDNTRCEFVAVFQNSHRSQNDHKKLLTRKSYELEKLSATSGLVCLKPAICKYPENLTVKVWFCSSPPSKQKCYLKKN